MKIKDKESARGEVTVELDKNLIERTVGWLQGRIAAKDPKLRVALLRSIPVKKGAHIGNALPPILALNSLITPCFFIP